MASKLRLVLFLGAAIVLFDVVASIASKQLGFPYTNAFLGSCLLYAIGGFLAARQGDPMFGAQLGVLLGLVDATLGWAVSSAISPNLPAGTHVTIGSWMIAARVVVLTSVFCALVGGAIGSASRKFPHSAVLTNVAAVNHFSVARFARKY